MTTHPKATRLGLALALALGLAACSATYTNHGYIPPPEDLATVQPGVDTRASVDESIGQPTAAGVVGENTWFYVASRHRHYTYNAPEVVERDIVAITFDAGGRVQNIRELGLEDGQVVRFSRRVTESNIQEISFLRQLIGNFGRINVGEVLGGSP